MTSEISNATRTQFLNYGIKAQVNVRPNGRSGPARVAEHVLNPTAPIIGAIVLDGAKGSGLMALTLDSANKVLATLERLETALNNALGDGTTLAGDTAQPSYYAWQNTNVTSGAANVSNAEYTYGDHSASIDVRASYGLIATGIAANLVDGDYAGDATSAITFNSVDVQGHSIDFDFGAPRVLHEATWLSSGADTQGTWVWQGSNDGRTYFSIGDSFALGGESSQVQDTLNANTTGYQYYRLYGISGTTGTQDHHEVMFKLIDEAPAPATQARNLSAASLNVIDDHLKSAKAAIDSIVSAAEVFGVNLLSSASNAIELRTSQYGGSLSVQAQPLDVLGLGLLGTQALSQADAEYTSDALQNAISSAKARIAELRTVSDGLQMSKSLLSGEFAGGASVLPNGSLVNLLG